MLVFQDYSRLEGVEFLVAGLTAQSFDRAQGIVVLKIVPVDGRGVEVDIRPASPERDQLFPLRACAVVVAQFCLNLTGARAIVCCRRNGISQSMHGGARLFQRTAIVLAQ